MKKTYTIICDSNSTFHFKKDLTKKEAKRGSDYLNRIGIKSHVKKVEKIDEDRFRDELKC